MVFNRGMSERLFVDNLEKAFNHKGFLTQKELGTGYGVADLVLVRLNDRRCELRRSYSQNEPLLKEAYFCVLKNIPDIHNSRKPISFESLQKKTNMSRSLLKYRVLKELEKNSYIKRVDEDYFFKINGWAPIAREIIAIEAKLHDWKRGLIQANRYKTFADKVYLALPENKAHLVDRSMLEKFNIGLITTNERTGKIREIFKPKSEKPLYEDKRSLISEFFWNYSA